MNVAILVNIVILFRVARIRHGPEFRGHKPVQVYFANYNDKVNLNHDQVSACLYVNMSILILY